MEHANSRWFKETNSSDNSQTNQTWFDENVFQPAYNAAVADPINAAANVVNGITRCETVSKAVAYEISRPSSVGAEMAQGMSSGLASLWPYLLAAKTAGVFMRTAGQSVRNASLATMLKHEASSLAVGAACYDALKDTIGKDTRFGNAAGGLVGLGMLGLANKAGRGLSPGYWFAEHATAGVLAGSAQLAVSRILSGQEFNASELRKAAVHGMALNLALPIAQSGLGRITDALTLKRIQSPSEARANSALSRSTEPVIGNGLLSDALTPKHSQPASKAPAERVAAGSDTIAEIAGGKQPADTLIPTRSQPVTKAPSEIASSRPEVISGKTEPQIAPSAPELPVTKVEPIVVKPSAEGSRSIFADGTEIFQNHDGSSAAWCPDGMVYEFNNLGALSGVSPDRGQTRVPVENVHAELADGTRITSQPDGTITVYRFDRTVTEHPQGPIAIRYSDGLYVEHHNSGTVYTERVDGTCISEYGDGLRVITRPDGTRSIRRRNQV